MTFSLDVDLWSIQTVPAQDATSRAADLAGRGQDFAASLFAAEPDLPTLFLSPDPALAGETSSLAFAALPGALAPAAAGIPAQFILMAAPPEEIAAPALLIEPGAAEADLAEVAEDSGTDAADAAEDTDVPADSAAPLPAVAAPATQPAETAAEVTAPPAAVPEAAILAAAAGGDARRPAPARPGGPAEASTDSADRIAPAVQHTGAQASLTAARPGPETETPAAEPDMSASLPDGDARRPEDKAGALAAASAGVDTETPTPPAPASSSPGPGLAAVSAPATFVQPAAQPAVTAPLVPTQAVLVATATEIPALVARASSDAGQESLVVQLDPPELGRVSIDFKFDAQGLQHVTVTAETPEAMRQLRAMHFELVQALERSGFTGQEMSFQQGTSQQQQAFAQSAAARALATSPGSEPATAPLPPSIAPALGRIMAGNGRLDIKL